MKHFTDTPLSSILRLNKTTRGVSTASSTRLDKLRDALVKERQSRIGVGGKRSLLDEPTEALRAHQLGIELVVRLLSTLQESFVTNEPHTNVCSIVQL